jgi:hypothetical protein
VPHPFASFPAKGWELTDQKLHDDMELVAGCPSNLSLKYLSNKWSVILSEAFFSGVEGSAFGMLPTSHSALNKAANFLRSLSLQQIERLGQRFVALGRSRRLLLRLRDFPQVIDC